MDPTTIPPPLGGIPITPWPRCKVCDGMITKGVNDDRIRNVDTDSEGRLFHLFAIDCKASDRYFSEEPEIVY
jgi:hypothetical protein